MLRSSGKIPSSRQELIILLRNLAIGISAILIKLVSMAQFLIAFLSFNVLMIEITSSVADGEKKLNCLHRFAV